MGIIGENNKVIAKMRLSNTGQGWSDFLKKKMIYSVIIEAQFASERTLRYLEDLNVQVKRLYSKNKVAIRRDYKDV